MRSDGMEFVVAAFLLAMVAMVAGGFAAFYFVGRRLFPGRRLHQFGFALFGLGLGVLGVVATFFEDVWAPPPLVRLELPSGFAHADVILLEDASATGELAWGGVELPFLRKSTTIAVPANGVRRLKSLAGLAGRGDVRVEWSDGSRAVGMAGGPGPPETRATTYVAYFREFGARDVTWGDETARGRYIRARESGG